MIEARSEITLKFNKLPSLSHPNGAFERMQEVLNLTFAT